MENAKEKSSRSGSKSDLNESSLPLLEGGEEIDLKGGDVKVSIEMETRSSDENAKDEGTKSDGEGKDSKDDKAAKKKEKKEKKEKKKKEKEIKDANTIPLAERLTAGLNLLDRDDRNVNEHVQIVFEDVLAEPDASHGFDLSWRLAFIAFSGTKTWIYKVVSAILAIPCAVLWAIIFSLLTVVNVWFLSPMLRIFFVIMHVVRQIWSSIIHTFLDPVFKSVGQLFSAINVNKSSVELMKEP